MYLEVNGFFMKEDDSEVSIEEILEILAPHGIQFAGHSVEKEDEEEAGE